jgi:putative ABC transport system permease protein
VLLVSAGLLIRSLKNVRAADLGFASNQVLEVSVNLRGRGWTPEQTDDFWKRAREAALRVNGVKAAGLGVIPPFQGRMMLAMGTGNGSGPAEMIETLQDFASPEYFDALGIRITEGRAFREDDRTNSDPVVIVNKQLAKRLFNSESAVGRCMPNPMGEGCLRIVGVADNARLNDITGAMLSYMWRPMTQRPMRAAGGILHVRTDGDPARLIATLRAQIGALAPDLPFVNVRGITEVLQPQLAPWRAATVLLSVLSFSGLVLATIGLYGVTAFLVSQRTRELGIRMALGANRGSVLALVLRQEMGACLIGVAVGVAGATLLSTLLQSLLFGVAARDTVTLSAAAIVLLAVTMIACVIPARRATQVDPVTALRLE